MLKPRLVRFHQKFKNIFWHLPKSIYFSLKYGFPSKKLVLIGVTGTDGKTTTCALIHEVLKQSGIKAGLITTIGAKIGDGDINTGLHTTSPDPAIVQDLFQKMVKNGLTHAVCEVTSHSLDQNRFWGCHFKVSVVTNTSHEHLDYHQNMDNYINSKAKLFNISDFAVLNKDDASFRKIVSQINCPYATYSIKSKSDLQAKNIKLGNALSFYVKKELFKTDSNYQYQIYNILAALGVCQNLKINLNTFKSTILKFPETKGRREEINNNFKFKTIIDFAHTPTALESTLRSLKRITPGNLIVIFGATGGRDKTKRPFMGETVSRLANIALITSDDTRNEKIEDINKQIISGINSKTSEYIEPAALETSSQYSKIAQSAKKKFTYFNIPNRQDAFNLALKLAQTGDTIIACGKGHETSILLGNTEYPWSEAEAFRTAFKYRNLAQ